MDWTQQIDQRAPLSAPGAPGPSWPRNDELTLTELVLPDQANHYGTLFGPNGLALLGKAAFLAATRFTRQSVVMAAAGQIEFLQPVPVGAVLNLAARVARVGRSSMTVRVVACFDAAPGTRAEEVLRGDFEMVAVDDRGRPCAVATAFESEALPLHAPHR
jgi:acyl-CoA thioesterase YciA